MRSVGSLRHSNDVAVPLNLSVGERLEQILNSRRHRGETAAVPHLWRPGVVVAAAEAAADRADERAVRVERERGHALIEERPLVVLLEEVLLDVGRAERADDRVVFLEILRDRADRFRTGEVADDRHEKVLRLEVLEPAEI